MAQNPRSATGRKKPRAHDPVKTRAAVLTRSGLVREVVGGLSDEQLARPSGLGEWSVREPAAHMSTAVGSVVRSLGEPSPGAAEASVLDWPFATQKHAGRIAEDTAGIAASAPIAELYGKAAARTRLLADALAVEALGASTEVRIPPFAVVRCIEDPRHTRGTPPNVVETADLGAPGHRTCTMGRRGRERAGQSQWRAC